MTRKPVCPVCRGRRTLTFALYRSISDGERLSAGLNARAKIEDGTRTYPCPECAPKIDPTQVLMIGATEVVSTFREEQFGGDYLDHVKRDCAQALAHVMLKEGVISFTRSPTTSRSVFGDATDLHAQIGVVMPAVVKTMEARIAARQEEIAAEVVAEACEAISRRSLGDGILRVHAVEAVQNALKTVLERRKRTEV